jgi:hypothetical protein
MIWYRTHRRMTSLTTDQIISETIWNALAVYFTIGKVPKYIRAPCKIYETPCPLSSPIKNIQMEISMIGCATL